MFAFVATLLLPTLIVASVPSHLISNLPGYGTTKTKQYSGFVTTPHPQNATITIHSHYWLIEAAAPLDPATAPTLIWFQGGPGGSSMIGLFTENGPLTLNDYSTQTSEYNKTKIPKVFNFSIALLISMCSNASEEMLALSFPRSIISSASAAFLACSTITRYLFQKSKIEERIEQM